MTKDPASHREEDILAVYGSITRCILSGRHAFVDPHHSLGRGTLFGIRPGDPRRRIMSSIFNFTPLERSIHDWGAKDHPELRHFFLRMAREHVSEAHHKGSYQITPLDKEFLKLACQWTNQNPVE